MKSWFPWVRRRRAAIRQTPLSTGFHAILDHNAPFVHGLDADTLDVLHGLIQLFLADKTFEGCAGLAIDDEIRVTIAAHASRLLLGLDIEYPYPGLDVIRVYPSTYRAPPQPGMVSTRLGESSTRGYVVLSWDAVRKGGRQQDGHNVVLHEFAHQLDTADGSADGAPPLERHLYGPWARILGEAYSELQQDVALHRHTVLDAYGATHPAEFFAVATETFFELPVALRQQEPELYAVLAEYYRQRPG